MSTTSKLLVSLPWTTRFLTALLVASTLGLIGSGCGLFGSEPVVPNAPTGLKATSGDGEAKLQWNGVEDASEYKIYRSTSSTSGTSGDAVATVSETSYSDESVENGTTFYYRVTGVADEESDPSEEVPVTPFSAPPDRP